MKEINKQVSKFTKQGIKTFKKQKIHKTIEHDSIAQKTYQGRKKYVTKDQ